MSSSMRALSAGGDAPVLSPAACSIAPQVSATVIAREKQSFPMTSLLCGIRSCAHAHRSPNRGDSITTWGWRETLCYNFLQKWLRLEGATERHAGLKRKKLLR